MAAALVEVKVLKTCRRWRISITGKERESRCVCLFDGKLNYRVSNVIFSEDDNASTCGASVSSFHPSLSSPLRSHSPPHPRRPRPSSTSSPHSSCQLVCHPPPILTLLFFPPSVLFSIFTICFPSSSVFTPHIFIKSTAYLPVSTFSHSAITISANLSGPSR